MMMMIMMGWRRNGDHRCTRVLDQTRPNPISNRPNRNRPTNIWEGDDPI